MAASVNDLWVSWFSCCVAQPQKRRHRIDRSMIGNPTNFVHTGHIGSRDVEMPGDQLMALQNQMKSKGGYDPTIRESLVTDAVKSLREVAECRRHRLPPLEIPTTSAIDSTTGSVVREPY